MSLKPYALISLIIIFLFIPVSGKTVPPENCLLFSITSRNTARLGVINTGRKSIDLTITNSMGEVFFTKSIRGENNFFQLLDLANMPDGNYTVTIADGNNTSEKRFSVTNSTAKTIKESEESKPSFIRPDDQTLIVSYLNTDLRPVNIFFMIDDEVVFEDRGLTGMALSKRYSLRQLPAGQYTVKLYTGDQIYSYPLVLN